MENTNNQAPKANQQTNPIIKDHVHGKNVEIQRLSWFDVLFSTIKDDLDSGNTHKAKKLADLGQYLAQDFQHYSEDELTDLLAEKGSL